MSLIDTLRTRITGDLNGQPIDGYTPKGPHSWLRNVASKGDSWRTWPPSASSTGVLRCDVSIHGEIGEDQVDRAVATVVQAFVEQEHALLRREYHWRRDDDHAVVQVGHERVLYDGPSRIQDFLWVQLVTLNRAQLSGLVQQVGDFGGGTLDPVTERRQMLNGEIARVDRHPGPEGDLFSSYSIITGTAYSVVEPVAPGEAWWMEAGSLEYDLSEPLRVSQVVHADPKDIVPGVATYRVEHFVGLRVTGRIHLVELA
jgi:hypothetical protein